MKFSSTTPCASLPKERDLEHFLQARTIAYLDRGKGIRAGLSIETTMVSELLMLIQLMKKVVQTSSSLVWIKKSEPLGLFAMDFAPLGHSLLAALDKDWSAFQKHFPFHHVHPYFDLFVKCVLANQLKFTRIAKLLNEENAEAKAVQINSVIAGLRKIGTSKKFVDRIKAFERTPNKNKAVIKNLLQALENCPEVSQLSIHLCRTKSMDWPTDSKNLLSLVEEKELFNKLFNFARDKISDGVRGIYLSRLGYSLNTGPTMDLVFVTDAVQTEGHQATPKEQWREALGPDKRLIVSSEKKWAQADSAFRFQHLADSFTKAERIIRLKSKYVGKTLKLGKFGDAAIR